MPTDPDDLPTRSRDAVLAHAYQRGRFLKWRRRVVVGTVSASLAGVLALGGALAAPGGSHGVHVLSGPASCHPAGVDPSVFDIARGEVLGRVVPGTPRPVSAEYVRTTMRAWAALEQSAPEQSAPDAPGVPETPLYLVQARGEFEVDNLGAPAGGPRYSVAKVGVLVTPPSQTTEAIDDHPLDLSRLGPVGTFSLESTCLPPVPTLPSSVPTIPSPSSVQETSPPAPTTSTVLVCRNSTNPACGPFRWDPPPPANQPITGHVTLSPANPRPGETVTFHLVADDPDAGYLPGSCPIDFGDGTTIPCVIPGGRGPTPPGSSSPPPPKPTGPWTPPSPRPGHLDICCVQHTYGAAGTYTATFRVQSYTSPMGPPPEQWQVPGYPTTPFDFSFLVAHDPYASDATITVTVTVRGTPVSTTTTSAP